MPRCDEGGNFTLVQCDHELEVCWCVDQEGIELENTRTSEGQPDCKRREQVYIHFHTRGVPKNCPMFVSVLRRNCTCYWSVLDKIAWKRLRTNVLFTDHTVTFRATFKCRPNANETLGPCSFDILGTNKEQISSNHFYDFLMP